MFRTIFIVMAIGSLCLALAGETAQASAVNLLHNGGFEQESNTRPSGWRGATTSGNALYITDGTAGEDVHSGTHALKLRPAGENNRWHCTNSDMVKVQSGQTYKYTFYVKTQNLDTDDYVRLEVVGYKSVGGYIKMWKGAKISGNSGWRKVSCTFTIDNGNVTIIRPLVKFLHGDNKTTPRGASATFDDGSLVLVDGPGNSANSDVDDKGVNSTTASEIKPAAPSGFKKLLHVDSRGGKVLRPADFNLTKPGAKWDAPPGRSMEYEQIYKNFGCYRLEFNNPPKLGSGRIGGNIFSVHGTPVQPNRKYVVSVLVKANFARKRNEFNVSLRMFGKRGNTLSPHRCLGLPAVTHGPDGWQRCEWTMLSPTDPLVKNARAAIQLRCYSENNPIELKIADIAFVKLPAKPLEPLAKGKGVTFPGGPGDLPMRIVSATQRGDHLIVKTTGAKYDFDTSNDTIIASQRIAFQRKLAKWHSSLSLSGLHVLKRNKDVCVLVNDQLTIGIQCDSMMAISPQDELRMTLTNLLGGDFNRYARGYLLSEDDFGGITVDPYIPPGTGLKPQSKLLTEGLAFAKLAPSKIDFQKYSKHTPVVWRAPRDFNDTGKASPGWQAQWITKPGELLCTSVFPPRPYPWKKSFTSGSAGTSRNIFINKKGASFYHESRPWVHAFIMWGVIPKTWGRSFTAQYKPWNAADLRANIKAIHSVGDLAIPYMSAFWSPTRDPKVYINAVRKWKNKYGIDGVYSDGLPSANWMIAYKEMRMLRALFPSGYLRIHNSIPQSGLTISQFMPFMYTYATRTLMDEAVPTKKGIKWQYPRYIASQFRKANCIGETKPNGWRDAQGKKMKQRSRLVDLIYNGRDVRGRAHVPKFYAVLKKLYNLWKQKGNRPHFYDRYYLPMAQKLTGYKIGRTAMPIVKKHRTKNGVQLILKSLTPDAKIYYTTNRVVPTKNSVRYNKSFIVSIGTIVKARAFSSNLDPSAIATIPIK